MRILLLLLANDHYEGQLLRENAHQYGQLIWKTDPSDKFPLATDLINGHLL